MLKHYLLAALVAGCLFAATVAHADDASHKQAAEDVLLASEADKNYEKSFLVGFDSQMKNLPPEVRQVGLDFSRKYLSWDAVKVDVIQLYTENFTEQELKDIADFYRTPTGKKSVTLMPSLMAKGMESFNRRIDEHKGELLAGLAAAKKEVEKRLAEEKKAAEEKAGPAPEEKPEP